MSNKVKHIDIKNHMNIKNFDHTKIFLLITLDMKRSKKDSKYIKINSVTPLYIIINKVNWYIEEINGDKYLMLVPNNESKKVLTETEIRVLEKVLGFIINETLEPILMNLLEKWG